MSTGSIGSTRARARWAPLALLVGVSLAACSSSTPTTAPTVKASTPPAATQAAATQAAATQAANVRPQRRPRHSGGQATAQRPGPAAAALRRRAPISARA